MTIDIELIEQAFDNYLDCADIAAVEENVNEVFTSLNSGNIRVAHKNGEEWIVNQWIKKAILLSFKLKNNKLTDVGYPKYYDKVASNFGCFIGKNIGSKFRSKGIIEENLRKFKTSINNHEIEEITKKMWGNYGRILAEYPFIPSFRKRKLDKYIKIDGLENLEKIKINKEPTFFI